MKLNAFLYMNQSCLTGKWEPCLLSFKADNTEYRVFVRECEVEVDVPSEFDPVAGQVEALRAAKSAEIARHLESIQGLNERLSKLLCIECAA